jgi:hypothetical protein
MSPNRFTLIGEAGHQRMDWIAFISLDERK